MKRIVREHATVSIDAVVSQSNPRPVAGKINLNVVVLQRNVNTGRYTWTIAYCEHMGNSYSGPEEGYSSMVLALDAWEMDGCEFYLFDSIKEMWQWVADQG